MKSHRKTIWITAVLLALAAAVPASAPATSLLSGYGGPGQGNQAILGSGLVNGAGAGGGSGGGSASAPAGGGLAAVSAGEGKASGSGGNRAGRAAPGKRAGVGRSGASQNGKASQQGAARLASGHPSSDSRPLGLSGGSLLFIVLVLAALLFTALLTRGLARSSGDRGHVGN